MNQTDVNADRAVVVNNRISVDADSLVADAVQRAAVKPRRPLTFWQCWSVAVGAIGVVHAIGSHGSSGPMCWVGLLGFIVMVLWEWR